MNRGIPLPAVISGLVVGVILLLWLILESFYTVPQHHVGIVIEDGVVEGEAEPGLNFISPFFTDMVYIPTSPTTREVTGLSMASADNWALQSSTIEYTYSVPPQKAMELYETTPQYVGLIETAIGQYSKNVVGEYELINVPNKRHEIEQKILEKVQADLEESTGIENLVKNVVLASYQWEEKARDHLADIRNKQQELKKAKLDRKRDEVTRENEEEAAKSEARRKRIRSEAQAEATVREAEAEAKAKRVKNKAKVERLQRIVEAVGKDNAIQLLRWENWDGSLPRITAGDGKLEVKNTSN